MEAMVCRAGAGIPSLIVSTSRLPSSKSLRSQCALWGGRHSPHVLLRVVVSDARRNERRRRRRSSVAFSRGDAGREAVSDDSAELELVTRTLLQPRSGFQIASLPSWIVVTLWSALLFATAFWPSVSLGPLGFLREGLYRVGSPQLWQSLCWVAVFLHVLEAVFAFYLARRVDPPNAGLWFWQTLYLGVFSLTRLVQKSKQKENLKHNSET